MQIWHYVASVIIGYLLGAIPTGLIVGKVVKGVDLRDYGSGKTGATNALRTLGKIPAGLVVLFDFTKGIIALVIVHSLTGSVAAQCLAGLAAAIGHNWPVYAGFRGGRGVLVSFGVFCILCWPAALISLGIGGVIMAVSLIVSLGVLVGTVVGLLLAVLFVALGHFSPWILLYCVLGAILIVARHSDNIQRLLSGTERKIGQPAQPIAG
ncbi:MAG TPA: glycerol-3-phosphate 1-O-acyltransferase PlsY [Chloroflexota bacterium]|nr:glycerol-3-phosphate 1-O-acyltransferase PlsY [Chloroflexota bacterium]